MKDGETKGEKRERKRLNNRKMVVHGRSIFTILRVKILKAKHAKRRKED